MNADIKVQIKSSSRMVCSFMKQVSDANPLQKTVNPMPASVSFHKQICPWYSSCRK